MSVCLVCARTWCMYTCHRGYAKVRRQPLGITSLLPPFTWDLGFELRSICCTTPHWPYFKCVPSMYSSSAKERTGNFYQSYFRGEEIHLGCIQLKHVTSPKDWCWSVLSKPKRLQNLFEIAQVVSSKFINFAGVGWPQDLVYASQIFCLWATPRPS